MNQAIELKFSGDVHQVSALNRRKKFCPCSTSLPATVHFGQNFGRLLRPHLLEFFFEKNFGEVLDLYQLVIGRNFEYLEQNGVFKFFKSLPVHLITTSTGEQMLMPNKYFQIFARFQTSDAHYVTQFCFVWSCFAKQNHNIFKNLCNQTTKNTKTFLGCVGQGAQ